jgi:hypothetical protein
MQTEPSKTDKLFFGIILGAYSTFFAEVLSGADLFPFFHGWGLLTVTPLYLLHTLVLLTLVYRHGRPTLYALYTAGLIFGLYEAYITKVLWNPPFGETPFSLAGVAVSEVVVLVFFWHPVMSFIIPTLLAESSLTHSRAILSGLPRFLQRVLSHPFGRTALPVLFALTFGLFPIHGAESAGQAFLAALLDPAVLLLLTFLWHKRTQGKGYTLKALLPGRWSFRILLLLLLSMYAGLGIFNRPEALPAALIPHLIIWLLYGFAYWLLRASLKKSSKIRLVSPTKAPSLPYKLLLFLWLLFVMTFSLGHWLIGPNVELIILTVWLGSSAVGLLLLALTIRDTQRRAPAAADQRC